MRHLKLFIVFAFYFIEIGDCQCDGKVFFLHQPVILSVLYLSVVRLAAAVHKTLSPFMSEMSEGLAAVKERLIHNEQSLKEGLKKISDFNMAHHGYECGGSGGWRRVVYLNMTDSFTNCPSGWKLTSLSKRTCGRANGSRLSCDSVVFPVSGGDYTSVCGSIRAYQYGGTDAFETFDNGYVTTIDGAYVSGVSLTHGSPRQHIWTFAAGLSEGLPTRKDVCPCDASITIRIPPFMGGDYFCESGVELGIPSWRFYPNDPLWDGQGCSNSSTCCSFNNPPYFTKQLPSPTSDTIEARLCQYDENEDTAVEFIELYVK